MAVRLFVGNLSYETTEADLRELFSAIGPLSFIHLATDRETRRPRGFAFVEFNDPAQAEEAILRFNNQPYKGRPLAVNEARAKEDRPRPAERPGWGAAPRLSEPPAPGGAPARNFGPDASPRRSTRGKPGRRQQADRAPKGPLRERVGGQFFSDDDNSADDDMSGENFASRTTDAESDENAQ